jgi:heat shock protein HslJ
MRRDVSAAGERYVAENDPTTVFWSEGSQATLKIKGREYSRYVLLRSAGEEDEFLLTADGKNYRLKQAVSASGAKYEGIDSPETFFWSKGDAATLFIEGVEYAGYDTWLPDGGIWLTDQGLPTELEWKVSSIAGSEVIPGSTVTLTFHADGSLSGKAVNTYRASWIASGSKLLILRGVSTKMMGEPQLMEQETALLDFLPKVVRFKIRKNGLTLVTRDGAEMVLENV